jgi:hypothetical protein
MVRTTVDLIKFLPIESDIKKELLESYENYNPDKKYNIGMMLWAVYDALFAFKLERNLEIAYEEAANNREKLDENFYQRVRELTISEMNQLSTEDIKAAELNIAREKLSELIDNKN